MTVYKIITGNTVLVKDLCHMSHSSCGIAMVKTPRFWLRMETLPSPVETFTYFTVTTVSGFGCPLLFLRSK